MEPKLTEEEVYLFYLLRDDILELSRNLDNDVVSHTDAASFIHRIAEHINWVYDQMAKK